jgi:hypothetical protein
LLRVLDFGKEKKDLDLLVQLLSRKDAKHGTKDVLVLKVEVKIILVGKAIMLDIQVFTLGLDVDMEMLVSVRLAIKLKVKLTGQIKQVNICEI